VPQRIEQRLQTCERILLEHDIAQLEDDGASGGQQEEEEAEEEEASLPRMSTRTMNILVGKTSAESAPPLDSQPSSEPREEDSEERTLKSSERDEEDV